MEAVVLPVLGGRNNEVALLHPLFVGNHILNARVLEALLDELFFGAFHVLIAQAKLLGNGNNAFPVAQRIAHVRACLLFMQQHVVVQAVQVRGDVLHFELRGGGKNDVGEQAVVFHPRMLRHDELKVRVTQSALHLVAAVPAGLPARRVGPNHVDAGAARLREVPFDELVSCGQAGNNMAAGPMNGRVHNGLRNKGLRDEVGGGGKHGPAVVNGAQVGLAFGTRQRVDVVDAEQANVHEVHLASAGLAELLHNQQGDFQTSRLGGVCCADEAAAGAVTNGYGVMRPVTSQCLDLASRNAADRSSPSRRLGNAVFLAQNVVLEPVEANGALNNPLAVEQAFGHPYVGDSALHGGVGVRQNGDPLVSVSSTGVVQVGGNEDLHNAGFGQEALQNAGHHAAPAPRRGFGVAGPHDQAVAVFADVLEQVLNMTLLANGLHAPHVLCTPGPAFPGVGLACLQGVAAQKVEQFLLAAMGSVQNLGLAMAVALQKQRFHAVSLFNAHDFFCANVSSFVPGNTDVLGFATGFGMTIAIGIPVNALQRERNAVLRVNALLVAVLQRAGAGMRLGLKHGAVARGDLPGAHVFDVVLFTVVHGANAQDLSILHINCRRVRSQTESAQAQGLVNSFSFA